MSKQDLSLTISMIMRSLAEETIEDNDPGELIGEKDRELLARRVLEKLGIETRAKLYVDLMHLEVSTMAKEAAEKSIQDKLKKVTRQGLR